MRDLLRVLRLARRHALWIALAMLAMVAVATSTVFAYNLVRPLYDRVLGAGGEPLQSPGDGPLVDALDRLAGAVEQQLQPLAGEGPAPLLLLVLLALAAKNLGTLLARHAAARFGLSTIRDLRNRVFDALLEQTPGWLLTTTTGVLVSRVVNDVQQVHEALSERFGDLLQDLLTVVLLVVYLFALDPVLAGVTLLLAPLLLAPVLHFSRRLRWRARQSQERMGELTAILDETLRGIRVVQAFGMQAQSRWRFGRATQGHFLAQLRARTIQAANAPVMEMVGAAAAMALVAYAARRIDAGDMTLGDFSAFLVAAYGTYNPLKRLNKFNLALQQAAVAAERVYQVVDAVPTVREAADAVRLTGVGEGIELSDVHFSYTVGRPALHGVDLSIPRGTSLALVGPSGAGKTTVSHLVLRFADPDRGAVRIGGRDLRSVTLESLRSMVGLVTQETLLFDDSVLANIIAGSAEADLGRAERAARMALADEFIHRLPEGYHSRLGEGGSSLSAGQRQRLAIARALYRDPAILILDEATAALDVEAERVVMAAFEQASEGRTTLLIAHRLAAARAADRIAVLVEGRVVERGSHEELVRLGGVYGRMVRAQEIRM